MEIKLPQGLQSSLISDHVSISPNSNPSVFSIVYPLEAIYILVSTLVSDMTTLFLMLVYLSFLNQCVDTKHINRHNVAIIILEPMSTEVY